MRTQAPTKTDKYDRIRKQPGEVPKNYFACAGGPVRSMTEVAQALGITRQAVHQIERAALWKLRKRLLACWLEHTA